MADQNVDAERAAGIISRLPVRNRPNTLEETKQDFLDIPFAIGDFVAQMLPGAGVVEAVGGMDENFVSQLRGDEAEDIKSLKANIEEGNYFDAGLQGVGAAGDVVSGIGAVMAMTGFGLIPGMAVGAVGQGLKAASRVTAATTKARKLKEQAAPVYKESDTLPLGYRNPFNPLNPTASMPDIEKSVQGTGYNPPLKRLMGDQPIEETYLPSQAALGKMKFSTNPATRTLTAEAIMKEFKKLGVANEDLDYSGLRDYLKQESKNYSLQNPGAGPRKFSFNEINERINLFRPKIETTVRMGDGENFVAENMQRVIAGGLRSPGKNDGYFEMDIYDADFEDNGLSNNPVKFGDGWAKRQGHTRSAGTIAHVRGSVFDGDLLVGDRFDGQKVAVIEEMQQDLTQVGIPKSAQKKAGVQESELERNGMLYATPENTRKVTAQIDKVENHPEFQVFKKKLQKSKDLSDEVGRLRGEIDEVSTDLAHMRGAGMNGVSLAQFIGDMDIDVPSLRVIDVPPNMRWGKWDANSPGAEIPYRRGYVSQAPTDESNITYRSVDPTNMKMLQDAFNEASMRVSAIKEVRDKLLATVPDGTPFPDALSREVRVLNQKLAIARKNYQEIDQHYNVLNRIQEYGDELNDSYLIATATDAADATRRNQMRNVGGLPDAKPLSDYSSSDFSTEQLIFYGMEPQLAEVVSKGIAKKVERIKNGVDTQRRFNDLQQQVFDLEATLDPGRIMGVLEAQDSLKDVPRSITRALASGDSVDDIMSQIFIQNPPHKTRPGAGKFNARMLIKRLVDDGTDVIVFPNARDIAATRFDRSVDSFDVPYNTIPSKVMKEFKDMGFDVEIGTIDPYEFENVASIAKRGKDDRGSFQAPAQYIKFNRPDQLDNSAVKLYNKGGYVGIASLMKAV